LSAAAAIAVAPLQTSLGGIDRFGRDRDWSGNDPVPYPEPAWEVKDPRFSGNEDDAPLQRIWHGIGTDSGLWCEGPVWMGDWGALLWSDIPNNRVLRWNESDGRVNVFQSDSGYANGHARDTSGRLIAMEGDPRRVRRLEYSGEWSVLCDAFEGKKLNGPNDVAVHRDGSIYFTDPGYSILGSYVGRKATPELPTRVYRIDARGRVSIACEGVLRRPNGICFSPDYRKAYVVDSAQSDGPAYRNTIVAFDIRGGELANPHVFADFAPGGTDGIRCDTDGNLWCSWGWGGPDTNGVRVHHPDGALLAILHTPEIVANLCFGGPKRNRLFMCASTSIYSVYVNAIGHTLT
jgi:gluconolactonase